MKFGSAAGSSVLGATLFAAFVLRGPAIAPVIPQGMQSEVPVTTQNAEIPGKSSSRTWPDEGPWQASRKHFSGIWPGGECPAYTNHGVEEKKLASLNGGTPGPQSDRQGALVSNPREQVWCIPKGEQVRAMIAIVPDPVHTHMALLFDRSVEAVQLAGEAVNYVIDRYWLPWEPVTAANGPSAQGKVDKGSQPGLLMFRWNADVDKSGESEKKGKTGASLLYVFLVTDTSTAGINGDQFSKAVDYMQVVCGAGAGSGCGNSSRIAIMGPTFSGSLSSLRRLTESKPSQLFTAYSGTISSICALQNQHLLAKPSPECGEELSAYTPLANLEFKQSLVVNTETAVGKFLGFLKDSGNIRCGDPSDVAILSEAATTYGGVSRSVGTDKSTCEYASFAFPREISSLRNAYQSVVQQTPAADPAGSAAPQSSLPFNLADRQPNNSDEPPDFSQPQGPLSKEAVLMDFAANLRRGQYKYVGIIGSNVLDVLFLASFLRSNCPDTRLFVLNSDLLFERNPDNAPYIGTLTVATYPLFGRNLNWANPGSRLTHLPFADQYEEGLYNASLLTMQEVLPPQTVLASLYEVREPFTSSLNSLNIESATLPLWVTAVGTGGFWPVQVIHNEKSPPADSPVKLDHMDFSGGWKAFLTVLIALAFLHSFILLTATPLSPRLRDFAVIATADCQRLFFIQAASACLAICIAMACTPAWRYGMHAEGAVLAIAVAAPFAIGGLFIVCIRLHYICRMEKQSPQGKSSDANNNYLRNVILSIAVWLTAFLVGCLWWRLMGDDLSHYGFFFAYRTIYLATGVSPFTPMIPLFVALYFWCICETWRLRFNDQVRPRLDSENSWPGAATEGFIAHSVNRYWLNRGYFISLMITFAVWLFFLNPINPFHLFERYAFGRLYEALFCVVVALMLSSGFRLAQIWAGLRKLLYELERSPILHTFSRLKGESWSPIWQSGGQEDEWTNIAQSFEAMKQIRLGDKALDPRLNESIRSTESTRVQILDLMKSRMGKKETVSTVALKDADMKSCSDHDFFRQLRVHFSKIQAGMAVVFNNALRVLQEHWDSNPSEDAAEEKPGDNKQVVVYCAPRKSDEGAQQIRRLEEYVALRYVAFIRGALGHVRHLLIYLAISFSLVLLSLNIYSFEPHRSLVWSLTVIFIVIGLLGIGVLMEAYRNQILSRISGTKPNELGLSFYIRVISLGAAPLITILATHFPSIGRFLLSFFQPGLEALK